MGLSEIKLDDVANGILFVIIGLLSWLGINRGKKAKAAEEPVATKPVEIAGALIDSRKADMLIEALDRNTEALRHHGKMIDQAAEDLREVNFEVRSMTKEIIRTK